MKAIFLPLLCTLCFTQDATAQTKYEYAPLQRNYIEASTASNQPEIIVSAARFELSEAGGFLIKTAKEVGSKEAQFLIVAGCAAFGLDCRNEASAISSGTSAALSLYLSLSVKWAQKPRRAPGFPKGESDFFVFDSPEGYKICRAAMDFNAASISGESSMRASIIHDAPSGFDNGVAIQTVVPKNRPSPQWIHVDLVLKFVRIDVWDQHDCLRDRTQLWSCSPSNRHCTGNAPGTSVRLRK